VFACEHACLCVLRVRLHARLEREHQCACARK